MKANRIEAVTPPLRMPEATLATDNKRRPRGRGCGGHRQPARAWDRTRRSTALREGRDCVSPVTRFPVDAMPLQDGRAGSRRTSDRRRARSLPHSERLHRVAQMMILALARSARAGPRFSAGIERRGHDQRRHDFWRGILSRAARAARTLSRSAASLIANYPPQKPVMDAQEAFGISAPCQVIANACASGTNAIGHAFDCIRSGRYQRVLTGGYDALSELVFVGFDSLQASTPEKCRPFDRERTGLVLGEGAAILRAGKFRLRAGPGREDSGRDYRLRHLDRQSSPHPAKSIRQSDRGRRWNAALQSARISRRGDRLHQCARNRHAVQ